MSMGDMRGGGSESYCTCAERNADDRSCRRLSSDVRVKANEIDVLCIHKKL